MSATNMNAAGPGKKAVHVKWAGKTIALGTFPAAEADEKCARAKALTRAWRSTMRPKPSREWVMVELERLGVRVVSGRLGRKLGEEDGEPAGIPDNMGVMKQAGPSQMERNNSLGLGGFNDADLNQLMARRNSSLGLGLMDGGRRGSLSSLGQVVGLEDMSFPPHRPMVGGGAAAAYEAARHDHFSNMSGGQQRRSSSLGLGSLGGNFVLGGGGTVNSNPNPNQHYEMLKLHHMNLLNEIQETTLMMNLYQQQQLQQQQQQLQQDGGGFGDTSGLGMMHGNGGLDMAFGPGVLSQRGSLAFGSNNFMSTNSMMLPGGDEQGQQALLANKNNAPAETMDASGAETGNAGKREAVDAGEQALPVKKQKTTDDDEDDGDDDDDHDSDDDSDSEG